MVPDDACGRECLSAFANVFQVNTPGASQQSAEPLPSAYGINNLSKSGVHRSAFTIKLIRPPRRSDRIGSHLRGDPFYGEIASPGLPKLTVRSEIGPYRRPHPSATPY